MFIIGSDGIFLLIIGLLYMINWGNSTQEKDMIADKKKSSKDSNNKVINEKFSLNISNKEFKYLTKEVFGTKSVVPNHSTVTNGFQKLINLTPKYKKFDRHKKYHLDFKLDNYTILKTH